MRGKPLMIGLLAFAALFGAALYYFQTFAYYERTTDPAPLAPIPVTAYEGIDAATSPLKLRGCFTADPAAFAQAEPAPDAEPLVAPFWFRCFDARAIAGDLEAGRAAAYSLRTDDPAGFDTMAALYPDGRGYLWRQLNARFTD
jgi:hypothetical protein